MKSRTPLVQKNTAATIKKQVGQLPLSKPISSGLAPEKKQAPQKPLPISKPYTKGLVNEQKQAKIVRETPIAPKKEANSLSSLKIPEVKNIQLFPCQSCGRTFCQEALQKHSKICKKIFVAKRKEFNSAKQRIVSKEQVNLLKKKKGENPVQINQTKNQMPKWKQDSLAFRNAMKQVKGVQLSEEEVKINHALKKNLQSQLINCKFCGRSFNSSAAERHIPTCEKKAKENAFKRNAKPTKK